MKLAQKLLSTISFNLEENNRKIAVEVLKDIKEFYRKPNEKTVLESELALCIAEILINRGKY